MHSQFSQILNKQFELILITRHIITKHTHTQFEGQSYKQIIQEWTDVTLIFQIVAWTLQEI